MTERATDVTQFHSVDSTSETRFLLDMMQRFRSLEGHRAGRAALLDHLRLREGDSAIDVGCGFGDDAAEMAHRVGAGGQVVGVDRSETMIGEARRRHPASIAQLSWRVADALDLPFEDGSFDAGRAGNLLQHVPDPAAVLREMTRLLRPGGRLAVFETDQATMFIDSSDRETAWVVCHTFAAAMVQGWIGRQLPRLFREAGLVDLTVEPRTIVGTFDIFRRLVGRHVDSLTDSGLLPADAVERWWSQLAEAEQAGVCTMGVTAFLVTGTKP